MRHPDEVGDDPAAGSPQSQRLRSLPQLQRLLESDQAQRLFQVYAREPTVAALRTALDLARTRLKAGEGAPATPADLLACTESLLQAADRPILRRVINATGVVLHTNLGRALLAAEAIEAMTDVARGYANLEFDLDAGQRGSRTQGVEPLLCELTGAEAALAVNNAAAAVLLALSALAGGGEVIVSRGELVEIGGGFRIPEVIAQGGARLVEVGTTNKTRLADYERAITPQTRMLLKVHQSNYRIVGFTGEATLAELAGLGGARDLILMQDLGSGALLDLAGLGRAHEPTVKEALAAGADLVAFSGDKLMGGPQAGLLVGARRVIDPLRRHPLLRAVRLDKTTLAALEATLRLYRDRAQAISRIPTLRVLAQAEDDMQARAQALSDRLAGCDPVVEADIAISRTQAYAGGGASPQAPIASRAVTIHAPDPGADELARRLRAHRPAVLGRIADGRVVLDMIAVADDELDALASAICRALRP